MKLPMLTPEPENPFQSPATVSLVVDGDQPQTKNDLVRATLIAAARWSLICGISAIPRWVIAAGNTTAVIGGMATGVLLFIVGYTFLDVWTRRHPLRQRTDVKTTLAITYGTRIAISLLFPIGFFADMFCGVVALSITGFFFQTADLDIAQLEFTSTLLTTLIQGCLLNGVLAGYGLLVYAVCRAVMEISAVQAR